MFITRCVSVSLTVLIPIGFVEVISPSPAAADLTISASKNSLLDSPKNSGNMLSMYFTESLKFLFP